MKTVIEMAREAGAHPSHNPELYDIWSISDKALERFAELVRAEALAEQSAQPAVPDALTASDGESAEYMAGWNDCRQAMLSAKRVGV